MIILNVAANFGGELHEAGACVSVSPLVENRMIEKGLAFRFSNVQEKAPDEKITLPENKDSKNSLTCSICGKTCKNEFGFNKHFEACKKKV